MPTLPDWAIQVLQVVSILVLAPLVNGIIARVEAVIQQRKGPRILQPYYDIFKLLQKETVLPAPAGPVFRVAPYVSFAAYATIPLLIPALTTFGLPLGYMADFFGVGLILALASFSVSVAAVDSGSPYAQLGSSRLRSFGAFNEPTVIFVTFVLALTTHTDLPYAFGATIRSATVEVVRPSHLLMIAAFFMLVLNETGRIPVENHGGTLEFGQIEEGRVAEHSGPGLALLRWGSNVKQLLLFTKQRSSARRAVRMMMPSSREIPTDSQLAERTRKIMRVELTGAIGCAIIGAAFLAGSHTMREMSIFLFGWAAGCAFHLTQTVSVGWVNSRHKHGHGDDADD